MLNSSSNMTRLQFPSKVKEPCGKPSHTVVNMLNFHGFSGEAVVKRNCGRVFVCLFVCFVTGQLLYHCTFVLVRT